MTDVIDALKRLERVGSENSKTTQKLIAAATELSAKIVQMYALGRNDGRVDVASAIVPTPPDDLVSNPWGAYFIQDGKLFRDMGLAWVAVDCSRDAALKFAEDIAHGLLHHLANNLAERNDENEQALAVLDAGLEQLDPDYVQFVDPKWVDPESAVVTIDPGK